MHVAVDQARDHGLAGGVDDTRLRADQGPRLLVRSDENEDAVADGHGFRGVEAGIDGQDLSIEDDEVGGRGRGPGRGRQAEHEGEPVDHRETEARPHRRAL
jgi:hypothetical protein